MERRAVCVVNTVLDSGRPVSEFMRFCIDWLSNGRMEGVKNNVHLLYLVETKDEVKKSEEMLEKLVPVFEERGIGAQPDVRLSSIDQLAQEINALRPEIVFMAGSKLAKKLRDDIIGVQVEYPPTRLKKKVVATTAALGIGSILWYYFIFTDLDFVNRYVLARKFYSGIVVAVLLVITVSLYGTFIGNLLRFMGLDTKSAH